MLATRRSALPNPTPELEAIEARSPRNMGNAWLTRKQMNDPRHLARVEDSGEAERRFRRCVDAALCMTRYP